MIYAQIKSGQKLHLAYEAGEGPDSQHLVQRGHVSKPLCNDASYEGAYRMTINVPLANACQRCHNIYDAPHRRKNAAATNRAKKAAGDLFDTNHPAAPSSE